MLQLAIRAQLGPLSAANHYPMARCERYSVSS
jgi:hypothetical protein